ncbi:MAG: Asp-tRNA(Asn)/Glu-tRNA(Gln) amidotransferase subunit GatA, partial [Clostridiaceae bacterium]|nr:Asp-tRNA(Asn)/Glu-tRNA(Gln) amidotransferase subunit GatA [Clostridiaceae bacterium]
MELHQYTIHELCNLIRQRKVGVYELTKYYLNRIKQKDCEIGAYINVTGEDALKRAEEVQKGIDSKEFISPLAGIPMALKDNICTEGIPTTCASKMLSDFIPPYNATVVDKLYQSGAILLGKLNMDEFAMGSSTESSYFKKTRNPADTKRVPGGSSGGAAAAVAAGEAVYTLGSDTGGSIRQPASFCGVVGLKPTYGTVSRFGLIAYASSFDQIGPITKDVMDCAIVFNAIAGKDKMDATSSDFDLPDYVEELNNIYGNGCCNNEYVYNEKSKITGKEGSSIKNNRSDILKGMKIGIPREFVDDGVDEDIRKAILEAVKVFLSLGAECEEFSLPIMEYVIPTYYIIAFAEASSNLARYDGIKFGHRAEKFEDLLDFYKTTRSEGFGVEVKRRILLGTYVLSSGYYDAYYKKAIKARTLITRDFNKAFEKYDIIMGPVTPDTAFKIGEKTDDPIKMYMGDIFTVPINIVGLPAISIPCGTDKNNLPI